MEVTNAATLPFISAAPLPTSRLPLSVGINGLLSQSSKGPAGTTSVCPRKVKRGPLSPKVAHKLSTSPNLRFLILNPSFLSLSATSS